MKYASKPLPWRTGLIVWAYLEVTRWSKALQFERSPRVFWDRSDWMAFHVVGCHGVRVAPARDQDLMGEACDQCWSILVDLSKHKTRRDIQNTIIHECCHLKIPEGTEENVYVLAKAFTDNAGAMARIQPVKATR